ncbi:MAG: CopG family transcriptional regulator [Lautropia sp.]
MRTTLAIDDDVLAAAKHLAERDRKTVGEVVSALARQGLARSSRTARAERNGVPLLASRRNGIPVTPELVNSLRDELP